VPAVQNVTCDVAGRRTHSRAGGVRLRRAPRRLRDQPRASIEACQEIGRAGGDGRPATARLQWTYADVKTSA
jgi:hypothetical protein